MKSFKLAINLYRIMLFIMFLIVCLVIFGILYEYVLVNIDLSELSIKNNIIKVFNLILSSGIFLILLGIALCKLFSIVYDMSDCNLLECLRQDLLNDYKISSREASLQLNNGKSIYAESLDYGIFFKLSYQNGKAVIHKLSSDEKSYMKCSEITAYDLEVLTNKRDISYYRSEAYDKMIDNGFSIIEYYD